VLRARCAAWPARFPAAPAPGRDWLLVCLAEGEAEARGAAAEAAAAGFERGVALEGGLSAYERAAHAQARGPALAGAPRRATGTRAPPRCAALSQQGLLGCRRCAGAARAALPLWPAVAVPGDARLAQPESRGRSRTGTRRAPRTAARRGAAASQRPGSASARRCPTARGALADCVRRAAQTDLRYIGRDALAVLLGLAGEGGRRCDAARVLDVRRADERALYGSIPGARRRACPVLLRAAGSVLCWCTAQSPSCVGSRCACGPRLCTNGRLRRAARRAGEALLRQAQARVLTRQCGSGQSPVERARQCRGWLRERLESRAVPGRLHHCLPCTLQGKATPLAARRG